MEGPGQVVGDLDTEKPEALDHFHFIPTDVDRGMSSTTLPEVDDYLLLCVQNTLVCPGFANACFLSNIVMCVCQIKSENNRAFIW